MAWPAIVAAAASAAVDYYKGSKETSWKQGVSSQLDHISYQLNAILDAVEALKPWVTHEIRASVIETYRDEVEANRRVLDIVAEGVSSDLIESARDQLSDAATPMIVGALKLMNRDPAFEFHAPISVAVIGYVRFLRLSNSPKGQVSAFVNDFLTYYQSALDPNEKNSWSSLRNHAEEVARNQLDAWNSRCEKWWIISNSDGEYFGNVHGSLLEGRHGNPEWRDWSNIPPNEGWFPELPSHDMPRGDLMQNFINAFGGWRKSYLFWMEVQSAAEAQITSLSSVKKLLEEL